MNIRTALRLAIVIALMAGTLAAPAAAARKPKPTQPDIVAGGCVYVTNIESHSIYRMFIEATVTNGCAQVASIAIRLAHFSDHGEQYADSAEYMTLAPGATRLMVSEPPAYQLFGYRWKWTQIISVTAVTVP